VKLEAPVVRVTVSEDRAVVVRRGRVHLEAGRTHLRLDGVAPVLVDKTLRVEISGLAAKVGETRVHRTLETVVPENPRDRTEAQTLDAEMDAQRASREELALALATVRAELAMLDDTARLTLADVAVDAAHGAPPPRELTTLVERREKELRAEVVRLAFAVRDMDELLARLDARRNALAHPGTQRRTSLAVTLSAEAAGEATLTIEYVVPNACWRPQHTATLLPDETVHVATDACVWQATGEAWDDAELWFSTERPSLGKKPPTLEDDLLTVQRRPDAVAVETRHDVVQTAGLGVARAAAARLPGIDDGGEPRVIAARGPATVPTDGRPHRIPLSSFTSKATVELVCMPELAEAAIVRSVQTNAGATPLLAGPVDLVRQGGFVGRATCEFVAANETFELGWGPDAGVRVHFRTEEVEEEAGMLSGWAQRHVRKEVRISVLDDTRRSLRVTLREPVSEIEKVQLVHDAKETTDAAKPDADGFVRWDVALPARGRKELDLAYTMKRHKDVVGL
jgi:uncharacterized protein (TIGR02231 family)